jgi:hypothetical protein
MKKIIKLGSIFWIGIMASSYAQDLRSGTVVSDPVAYFQNVYEMSVVKHMYKLVVDLNNDGRDDILIGTRDDNPVKGVSLHRSVAQSEVLSDET